MVGALTSLWKKFKNFLNRCFTWTNVLGFLFITASLFTLYSVYSLWPLKAEGSTAADPQWLENVNYFFWKFKLAAEHRMLWLVMLCGVLGSLIHIVSSFTSFVGDKDFDNSWVWCYVLKPFTGAGIALRFYLVFRGGFFADSIGTTSLNFYGIFTVSALAGLFSDRATLKLQEIFESLFKPKDERGGKLGEAAAKEKVEKAKEGLKKAEEALKKAETALAAAITANTGVPEAEKEVDIAKKELEEAHKELDKAKKELAKFQK